MPCTASMRHENKISSTTNAAEEQSRRAALRSINEQNQNDFLLDNENSEQNQKDELPLKFYVRAFVQTLEDDSSSSRHVLAINIADKGGTIFTSTIKGVATACTWKGITED